MGSMRKKSTIDPVKLAQTERAKERRDIKRRIRQLAPSLSNLLLADISTEDLRSLRSVLDRKELR